MYKQFVWGLVALASSAPLAADDVSEEAFLAALDDAHPAMRALGADLAEAVAARHRAGTLANPRLEFWREQPRDQPRLTNWTVAWTPPLDGRFSLGKGAADARVEAARADLADERAALRREMRRVFAAWSVGWQGRALGAERLERVARLAEQERQRARVGAESGLSARRLTLAEAQARAALREAEAAWTRAEAEARAWSPDLPADASPVLPALPAPPEALDWDASPRVRSARSRLEQARLEERLSGRFWGFPTLQAGVQRLEEDGGARSGAILAASWTVPLFDRNQAERAAAGRIAQSAAARAEQEEALARAAVRSGLEAYRILYLSAREAGDAAVEGGRVVEGATAAYRAGEASLTDLLDAVGSAFDVRLRALEAQARALEAHRELEAAVGRPLSGGGAR